MLMRLLAPERSEDCRDRRAEDDDVHGREDQEDHREEHLDRGLMRQLFRPLTAFDTHLLRLDA